MRTHQLLRTGILAAVLALGGTAAALAHTEVRSTSPANGKPAKTTITRTTVTFNGQLRSGTLRVVGPGSRIVSRGKGGRDPRNVRRLLVGLRGGLKPGLYRASWTIVAADGHRQRGSFRFRLRR
ncbi:MAG: copper resistance protein CopC [Solirubrobacteraceae bacterium]|nr:copper resistance protein CopC [Solirubrobacteraceae bacterium]